jgi:serine/threonine protein phosphatase PrpC
MRSRTCPCESRDDALMVHQGPHFPFDRSPHPLLYSQIEDRAAMGVALDPLNHFCFHHSIRRLPMKTFSMTHQGRLRDKNEDMCFVKEFDDGSALLGVFDGLGGQAGGDKASEKARDSLAEFNPDSRALEGHLVELMQIANRGILDMVDQVPDLRGMGTTMTVAYVGDGSVTWAHVGDSRLYLFREGKLQRITEDDTIPGLLLAEGEIDHEEARVHPLKNVLFDCLGRGDFEAHAGRFEIQEQDILLLSTDGLHDEVPEEEMISILQLNKDLQGMLEALVSAALEAGGRDNITVVGAEV